MNDKYILKEFNLTNLKKKKFRVKRSQVLLRAQAQCELCWFKPRRRVTTLFVVPIKEIEGLKPEDYDIDNLQCLCSKCFNKKDMYDGAQS